MINVNDLPPAIGQLEANKIIDRIKDKTYTDQDRIALINGHLRFVWYISIKVMKSHGIFCDRFSKNNIFNLSDDVFSSGALALIDSVDSLIKMKHIDYNYIKYLNKSVSRRCQDAIRDSRLFSIPMRTIRHNINRGLNLKNETVAEIEDISESAKKIIALLPPMYQAEMRELALTIPISELRVKIRSKLYQLLSIKHESVIQNDYEEEENDEVLKTQFNYASYNVPKAKRTEVSLELKEILQQSICTLRERDIINYREQGMTYQEIGIKYSMSPEAVFKYVEAVRNRFDPLWDK